MNRPLIAEKKFEQKLTKFTKGEIDSCRRWRHETPFFVVLVSLCSKFFPWMTGYEIQFLRVIRVFA